MRDSQPLFKYAFRFEVPQDANLWEHAYAESEDLARVYVRNKIRTTRAEPITIKELVSTEPDERNPAGIYNSNS